MMKVNNSMDILLLRSLKGESRIASPYWVLDWLESWLEGRATRFATAKMAGRLRSKDFKITTSSNRNVIIIKGRVIGTVSALTTMLGSSEEFVILCTKVSSSEYYGTDLEVVNSIWQTLCFNIYDEDEKKAYREQFARLWAFEEHFFELNHQRRLQPWLDHNARFRIGTQTLPGWSELGKEKSIRKKLRNPTSARSRTETEWKLIQAIAETVLEEEMRLTVLDTGPVGVTHRSTQKGDIICGIIGCSAHVVLRESKVGEKTQYRIVGEARIYPGSGRTFAVKNPDSFGCREFWLL